jgi:DNA-binding MarR family transcriptional regulator
LRIVPAPNERLQGNPSTQLRILIGRLSRRLRQTEAGAGLTPTQLSVLATVVRHGPLGLAQLSQREGINPTMLSRIAAKLTDASLITRRPDPTDGRAALLLPTERGRRLHRRIQAERNDVLGQRIQSLPEAQRRLLIEALPALELLAEALQHQDR